MSVKNNEMTVADICREIVKENGPDIAGTEAIKLARAKYPQASFKDSSFLTAMSEARREARDAGDSFESTTVAPEPAPRRAGRPRKPDMPASVLLLVHRKLRESPSLRKSLDQLNDIAIEVGGFDRLVACAHAIDDLTGGD
jgi:hypothetical protein